MGVSYFRMKQECIAAVVSSSASRRRIAQRNKKETALARSVYPKLTSLLSRPPKTPLFVGVNEQHFGIMTQL